MGVLEGKVALITDAGQGVGRAVARAMAKEGAAIAVVDRPVLNPAFGRRGGRHRACRSVIGGPDASFITGCTISVDGRGSFFA